MKNIFLLFFIVSLSFAQTNDKVYYFYYCYRKEVELEKQSLVYVPLAVLIETDSTMEYHQYTFKYTKETTLKDCIYVGHGIITELVMDDKFIYSKCRDFKKYCTFEKK
jgi:hypothetical protein